MSQDKNILNYESKLKAKFDYLVKETHNKNIENNKKFLELDGLFQNKMKIFKEKLFDKKLKECKEKLETLFVYTDYIGESKIQDQNFNLTDLKPLRGHEKDYEESLTNLSNCTGKFDILEEDVDFTSKSITDMGILSNQLCLNRCLEDLKNLKTSEIDIRNCIESCFRYESYNLQAYYNIIFERISQNESFLDKI